MSKNSLRSKFALAAVLGSSVALSGCNDIVEICSFRDRAAFTSRVDPTYLELRQGDIANSIFAVKTTRPAYAARGVYAEDKVIDVAFNYCLNNEMP